MFSLTALRRAVASESSAPVIHASFYTVTLATGAVILIAGMGSTSAALLGAPLAVTSGVRLAQIGSVLLKTRTAR